jgi:hypothetical protein
MRTFETWLRDVQHLDLDTLPDEVAALFRADFLRGEAVANEVRSAKPFNPGSTGGTRYAVAIEDGADLRLNLWVKRLRGECYIFQTRGLRGHVTHASYHDDGRLHFKTDNRVLMKYQRQPLDTFRGREHLGHFSGFGVAAQKCDPTRFTDVISFMPGLLERATVMVDLVEPGIAPDPLHREFHKIVREEIYTDDVPHVVIAIGVRKDLS